MLKLRFCVQLKINLLIFMLATENITKTLKAKNTIGTRNIVLGTEIAPVVIGDFTEDYSTLKSEQTKDCLHAN